MKVQLKPVREQTIVVTGASSGIGLATARMAAREGARVVLVARSEEDLRQLEAEINGSGGQALAFPADVADRTAMHRVADAAVARFGGIDTWVNNAGVSIYGRVLEASDADNRRLFETDFWGVVYGSEAAVAHLRQQGGAIVNMGSVTSDRAIPLQGMYSAAKHAVKGYTDALRMELEKERLPISVTLMKPASIDTPFPEHARNNMEEEPALPAPVYAPEEVARAVLFAASNPVRDLPVGSASARFSAIERHAPRLGDRLLEKTMFARQKRGRRRSDAAGALHEAGGGLRERAGAHSSITRPSLYTRAYTRALTSPWLTGGAFVAGTALLVALLRSGLVEETA